MIHMKTEGLFSSKDKSTKSKCRLLQFLFGTLRVKSNGFTFKGSKLVFFPFSRSGLGSTPKEYAPLGANSYL